jgi:uncharacterized protein YegL
VKINNIFWFGIILLALVILPQKSFAVCRDNFSAFFEYQGQDVTPDGDFSNLSAEVAEGNYFKTKFVLEAVGNDLRNEGDNINIALVMDRSGSMSGGDKMTSAKEALNSIVNLLDNGSDVDDNDNDNEDNADNEIALITYNQNVTLDSSLSSQYASLKSIINSIKAGGSTNIGGALATANDHLREKGKEEARWFIVLASDGLHNAGVSPLAVIPKVDPRITVYTVGIGSDADASLLKKIAEESGSGEGKYYYSNVEDLSKIFENIIEEVVFPFQADVTGLEINLKNIDTDKFSLIATLPDYDSFSASTVTWNDLGIMKNKDQKIFQLVEKNENLFGQDLKINGEYVVVNYIEEEQVCREIIPIDYVQISNLAECIGDAPNNSEICPDDDKNLLKDWNRELGENCTFNKKCEYICTDPYVFVGGKCLLPINGHCGNVNAFVCGKIPENVLCLIGTPTKPFYNNQTKKWEWQCSGLYGGSSSGTCQAEDYCKGWYYGVNP